MKAVKFFRLLVLGLLLLWSTLSMAKPAWHAHGKLGVSKNGHFIEHKDGTPFLWIGDTAWGMFQQLTREEVDLYLDSRKTLGFSVIQAVAHWSPHGGGLDRSPDNAPNAYGHRPFTGSEGAPNTSEPLVINGNRYQAPNDYWDHADYVVEAVQKRNMYLALLPVWGSELITNTKEYNEKEAKVFGEFLGERYKDMPNIIWVLGGDTKAQYHGYNKHQVFISYDYRHIYRAMAEGIAYGVTGKKVAWDKKAKLGMRYF